MTNPSKAKGTAGETRVVNWLKANGYPEARRLPLAGNRDQGDLHIRENLIAEVKNVRGWSRADILTWAEQTRAEAINHGPGTRGILIVLRHGQPTQFAWVVQPDSLGNPWFSYLTDWVTRDRRG